jgi:hypothetical protein
MEDFTILNVANNNFPTSNKYLISIHYINHHFFLNANPHSSLYKSPQEAESLVATAEGHLHDSNAPIQTKEQHLKELQKEHHNLQDGHKKALDEERAATAIHEVAVEERQLAGAKVARQQNVRKLLEY